MSRVLGWLHQYQSIFYIQVTLCIQAISARISDIHTAARVILGYPEYRQLIIDGETRVS